METVLNFTVSFTIIDDYFFQYLKKTSYIKYDKEKVNRIFKILALIKNSFVYEEDKLTNSIYINRHIWKQDLPINQSILLKRISYFKVMYEILYSYHEKYIRLQSKLDKTKVLCVQLINSLFYYQSLLFKYTKWVSNPNKFYYEDPFISEVISKVNISIEQETMKNISKDILIRNYYDTIQGLIELIFHVRILFLSSQMNDEEVEYTEIIRKCFLSVLLIDLRLLYKLFIRSDFIIK